MFRLMFELLNNKIFNYDYSKLSFENLNVQDKLVMKNIVLGFQKNQIKKDNYNITINNISIARLTKSST